ncbi:putative leucine-rich repeat receptor-like serine/threonine-protein kinase [Iris pallida]|uniref:Leucine-rich repeat receptor-like serine/threonine-protein kinase n=1 Tax=Iris pallida TaxID=29817 RepID=A0AAX6FA03_IRIPA|nr:putative leucine-rich repeat receptor-like serine/threonine-protein kinase [Iris pallida]
MLLLLRLLFFFFSFPSLCSSLPSYGLTYSIDCGGSTNFTSEFNQTWLSDRFFSPGGSPALVAEPHRFSQPQERSLRFFPVSAGKKSCYSLPVPSAAGGRYYLRTFTIYDNYDSKLRSPSFDVSLGPTLVFSWRSPWPPSVSRSGAYSDLISFIPSSTADLCFYSIATDPPVVASIELFQVDPLSYDSATTGRNLVLVNYGRLTCGSDLFGPGFSQNGQDRFGRVWQSDAGYRNPNSKTKSISAGDRKILGSDQAPNFFPTRLYEMAVTTVSDDDYLEYLLPVDSKLDYMVWFHFAEIDPGVNAAGKRVFDVFVEGDNVKRIDIFKEVGGFSAFKWHYVVKNLTSTEMNVKLVPVVGRPVICGLENYAMVPVDLATVPSQVAAMRALKESLKVPDRMGWNGDPCAPTAWDTWEGVTCHKNEDGSALVITQLDLGSQGLKGSISDQISLLSNLVSVNLSSNLLGGTLPSGLGQGSLVKLDLSTNQFSGSIPDSLGSGNLQLVLLNNNELDGQVPEKLYSIGVHGGVIDLSGNKGLCGVPSLPACSFFWERRNLSTGGEVAIGLACTVVLAVILLIVYIFCIKKGRNDYDFGLPQDLTSVPAKRNRYQRQKSLLLLEMESQDSNGYTPTM